MDASVRISNPLIEDLCNRYASTRPASVGAEVRKIDRSAAIKKATDTSECAVEINEAEIEQYRDTDGYVTSDGFAALFKARREQVNSSGTGGTVCERVVTQDTDDFDFSESITYSRIELVDEENEKDVELQYGETVRASRPVFMTRSLSTGGPIRKIRSFFAFLFNTIRDWAELDPKALRASKKRNTFPIVALFAVLIIALALFLIVKSSVMLMNANRDVAELEAEINAIKVENALLDSRIEEKINLSEIERIATEELGMIKSEYVTTKYYSDPHDNTVTLYEDNTESDSSPLIATLLSALGFGGK